MGLEAQTTPTTSREPFWERKLVRQMARFLLLTGISAGLNFGITYAMHEWVGVSAAVGFATSIATVFVVNFLLIRFFVFPNPKMSFLEQLTSFFLASVGFRFAEFVSFVVIHYWCQIYYILALLFVQGVSFVCKFVLYRFFYGHAKRETA